MLSGGARCLHRPACGSFPPFVPDCARIVFPDVIFSGSGNRVQAHPSLKRIAFAIGCGIKKTSGSICNAVYPFIRRLSGCFVFSNSNHRQMTSNKDGGCEGYGVAADSLFRSLPDDRFFATARCAGFA
ncbi:hypothetical protein N8I74_05000 [Chitiniphilus purpureus]|uniref:Uncharacterized protein n=1 Tax=Chitiniphilus purpureus TaxID=2981137 RepID=A0ABY6DPV1_9NEIS|nr:hypothetical protein [Chitiniphilus sp. CD1]UXY16381.1 hypothetical protein N8I74_05000 [Chitiniphilus sp. CD1]